MSESTCSGIPRTCPHCIAVARDDARAEVARLRALLVQAREAVKLEHDRWQTESDKAHKHNPNDIYEYFPIATHIVHWNKVLATIDAELGGAGENDAAPHNVPDDATGEVPGPTATPAPPIGHGVCMVCSSWPCICDKLKAAR